MGQILDPGPIHTEEELMPRVVCALAHGKKDSEHCQPQPKGTNLDLLSPVRHMTHVGTLRLGDALAFPRTHSRRQHK
jgi:hypothetical protein